QNVEPRIRPPLTPSLDAPGHGSYRRNPGSKSVRIPPRFRTPDEARAWGSKRCHVIPRGLRTAEVLWEVTTSCRGIEPATPFISALPYQPMGSVSRNATG